MKLLVAIFTVAALCACSAEADKTTSATATSKSAIGSFGVDTSQMDTSAKPGDDFYKYVNGKWLTTFKIPADKPRYGMFDALRDKSENDVHALLDELRKTPQ